MEDDVEDDLGMPPASDDDQDDMVSILELLQSFKEEDGHPQPSLTSLTPARNQDQPGKGHSPVREVTVADSRQGSDLFFDVRTTAIRLLSMNLTQQNMEHHLRGSGVQGVLVSIVSHRCQRMSDLILCPHRPAVIFPQTSRDSTQTVSHRNVTALHQRHLVGLIAKLNQISPTIYHHLILL